MTARTFGAALLALSSCLALGQEQTGMEEPMPPERPYKITEEREPCADYEPLRRPHFGDSLRRSSHSLRVRKFDSMGQF